jgi:vancomycin resistance protein VanJ
MRLWTRRAAAAGIAMTALAQELWSPRSANALASVIGWTGPWTLAGSPWLALEAVRSNDPWMMGSAAIAMGLMGRRAGGHPRPGPVALRVYVQNVLGINRHSGRIAETVAGADPDLVVLSELHDRHVDALERAMSGYHFVLESSPCMLGLGVVSRAPIDSCERFQTGHLPGFLVRTGGISLVALHLPSPGRVSGFGLRTDDQVAGARSAAAVISKVAGPLIVAGDLNATRWNESYRVLLRAGALDDAVRAVTRDWFCTYPASVPVVRIDHCLTRGLTPRWARRLRSAGSDHRALLVGLDRDRAYADLAADRDPADSARAR